MPRPELVTTTDAARMLGVDTRTVTRWAQSGRLTPVKKLPGLRGAFLFDSTEVEHLAGQITSAVTR